MRLSTLTGVCVCVETEREKEKLINSRRAADPERAHSSWPVGATSHADNITLVQVEIAMMM